MTNKVHDISDLPADAPRNDEAATDATIDAAPGKLKNFLSKHKLFLIGLGAGVATGAAAVGLANGAFEDEDEIVETPES